MIQNNHPPSLESACGRNYALTIICNNNSGFEGGEHEFYIAKLLSKLLIN
jgi:hypothetical protein